MVLILFQKPVLIKTLENGKGISKSAIKATIKDGKMQITFVLKYGNMPFVMNCSSNATKK